MRLDLSPILHVPGGRLPFSFTLDLSALDFYGERPFQTVVPVSGEVRNAAGALMLTAEADAELRVTCDRCSVPFTRVQRLRMNQLLAERLENEDADEDIIVLDGAALDLDELVTTALILEMDTKNLCSEDCRGLCDRCGKNLNDGPCGCRRDADPRLAALAAFLRDGE